MFDRDKWFKDRKALLFLCLKGINVIALFLLYFLIAGWTSDISRAVPSCFFNFGQRAGWPLI